MVGKAPTSWAFNPLMSSNSGFVQGMKRDLQLEVYKYVLRQSSLPHKIPDLPMAPVSPEEGRQEETAKSPSSNHREKTNVFYDQFSPVFIVLIVFGRLSLKKVKSRYEWKGFSWLMVYCVLNYALQTYLAILVFIKRLESLRNSQRNYDELIFSIHILAYLNIHFHLPFTYWMQGPKLAEYINFWKDFQDEWFSTFDEELVLSLKQFVKWFTFITIPSVVLLLAFEKYSTLMDPWHYLLPYFFTIVSTMLILGLWYCTCLEIRRLSKKMTVKLIQNLEQRPNEAFLQKWRRLWISLSSLSSCLGSHLAAIVVSIFLTFSVTFLLGLYNALSHIIKPDVSWKTVGYLSASIMSLSFIYTFCDAGHKGTDDVTSYALQQVLKAKVASTSPDIRYELFLLVKSIEAYHPQIELAGFVTMNRHLFISFVSNTITYLIVILQFKFN